MYTCPHCGKESLTGTIGHKGIPYTWIFPEYTNCDSCGEKIQRTGWFSRE